jgi:hypothetical protein
MNMEGVSRSRERLNESKGGSVVLGLGRRGRGGYAWPERSTELVEVLSKGAIPYREVGHETLIKQQQAMVSLRPHVWQSLQLH